MINLVVRFRQINSAEISCEALRHPPINDSTSGINSVRTANPFLESELVILRLSNQLQLLEQTMFKYFRQNRTDGNPSKVITCHGFGATVFNLWNRHDITTFKTTGNAVT